VKADTEKAARILRVSVNLHLPLYCETVGYFEYRDLHDKFCLPSRETHHSHSDRIAVAVVKVYNTAYKMNNFIFVEWQTL
jgi:hypothetical protein